MNRFSDIQEVDNSRFFFIDDYPRDKSIVLPT